MIVTIDTHRSFFVLRVSNSIKGNIKEKELDTAT